MKKNHYFIIITLAALGLWTACSEDFLEIKPKGSLDITVLASKEGANGMLIGCYSMLDGVNSSFGWEAASSNWVFGDIRGMVGNKGTDAGDQPDINPIQTFSETSTNPYLNIRWRSIYEAISRCNNTILVTALALGNGSLTAEEAELINKQAKTLRGWYHLEAWRMWEKIPYVDENTDALNVKNDVDVRDKILADLTIGLDLPNDMDQVGRFNATVARVLLAKAYMQMYQDYTAAEPLLQTVKTSGVKPDGSPIGLAETYGEIFDIVNRNGIETIYTVQYSVNDGSGAWNGGWGEVLNFPYKGNNGSPGGCCGFFQATQEYVNSFRTEGGLPLLDNTYNDDPVVSDQGINFADPFTEDAGPLDPRLDWSVGRRGIPYWDWGIHTGSDWVRDQTYAGPYSPKKQVYKKSQQGQYTEVGNWTSGWTANGYRMIRYADVLLLLAECQIENDDLDGAFENINLVRERATNPDGFVMEDDGVTPAANYQVDVYPSSSAYPFDSQANARIALRMERKLELGMEGHRWFDLNRWGNTVTELNRVLTYEHSMPWGPSMYGDAVVGSEDVTYPIPQRQLDLANGNLVQNR